ncbi:hypothetical protein QNH20_04300 [Neobacillus sp. WH10]|uniref:hypothetical protein n=1 Tax=Neobacillus sp. WH10 TaxID=3047873 RepID=UPI0024C126E2|nr:hypothetical protein [Neobacillus sp. WH10]WHY80245.1 hypothetical protein QNH20_04300 [Neobacillus sp. WH10]
MAVEEDEADEDNGDIIPSLVDLFADCEKDLGEIVGIPSVLPNWTVLRAGSKNLI